MIPPFARILAAGALGLPLAAQMDGFPATPWYVGVDVNLAVEATPYGAAGDKAIRGKVGSGVELMVGWQLPGQVDVRLVTGYNGTKIQNLPWLDSPDEETTAEYARTWRFGAEAVFHPWGRRSRAPYLFLGGGVRETWVGRSSGSLAGASVAAVLTMFTGVSTSYQYQPQASRLDSWSGYGTAGLGWRLSPGAFLEVRFVAGSHTEFVTDGLTTLGSGPEVRRSDTSVHVALGLRGR